MASQQPSSQQSCILVPTDFGVQSKAALAAAIPLARALGASLHLVHVARDPMTAVTAPELYGINWEQLKNDIVTDAEHRLATIAKTTTDVPCTWSVMIGNRTSDVIAQAAADLHPTLIVMGTHGRGAIGHLVIGSVAANVIRQAACPVVTVREFGAVRLNAPDAAAAAAEGELTRAAS